MIISTRPTANPPADEVLLSAWHRGDMRAARILYRRHFDAVCRFFRNKLSNLDEVADLVGETFLELVKTHARTARSLELACSFRAYLLGIAKNVLFRHLRQVYRRMRKVEMEDEAFDRCSLEELAPRSLSSIVGGCRELDVLIKALRTLPLQDQILLEAKYFEYLMDSELARLVDIPETTVPGRLRGARNRLLAEVSRTLGGQARANAGAPVADLDAYIAEIRALIARTNPRLTTER